MRGALYLGLYLFIICAVSLILLTNSAGSETYQDRYIIPLVMCENDSRAELQHEYNKLGRYDTSAARTMYDAVHDNPRCPNIRR